MDWLQQNFIIIILQAAIALFIGIRERRINQRQHEADVKEESRQKQLDLKADNKTVGLKFKKLESDIAHEKEMREMSGSQQLKEIGEVKTLLHTILEKIM